MRLRSERVDPVEEEDLISLTIRGSDPAYLRMIRGVMALAN